MPNFGCSAGRGEGSLGLEDITPMNYHKVLWLKMVPLKNRYFCLAVVRNRVSTKDNLVRQ